MKRRLLGKRFMKRILIKSFLTVALALSVQAAMTDYLYLFVGDDEGNSPTYNSQSVNYEYATVKITGTEDSGYLSLYAGGANQSSGIIMSAAGNAPAYAELPNNYNDYTKYSTFLFELWDENANRLAWQRYNVGDVSGNIVGSNSQGTPLNVTTVVPEPTGGMLMLLGMAVLAMRRKTRMF